MTVPRVQVILGDNVTGHTSNVTFDPGRPQNDISHEKVDELTIMVHYYTCQIPEYV